LNRDLSKSSDIEVVWEDAVPRHPTSGFMLTGDDLKASNSFAAPKRVEPQTFTAPAAAGGRTRVDLPPHSYAVIQWSM